jgi:hypothetical protein
MSKARHSSGAWLGRVWQCKARRSTVWFGIVAWQGRVRCGGVRFGKVGHSSMVR